MMLGTSGLAVCALLTVSWLASQPYIAGWRLDYTVPSGGRSCAAVVRDVQLILEMRLWRMLPMICLVFVIAPHSVILHVGQ